MVQVVLSVGGAGWAHPRLGGPGLSSSQAKLASWVVAEDIKREVARARNELESYIIKMKDVMEGDELLHRVSFFLQSFGQRCSITFDMCLKVLYVGKILEMRFAWSSLESKGCSSGVKTMSFAVPPPPAASQLAQSCTIPLPTQHKMCPPVRPM